MTNRRIGVAWSICTLLFLALVHGSGRADELRVVNRCKRYALTESHEAEEGSPAGLIGGGCIPPLGSGQRGVTLGDVLHDETFPSLRPVDEGAFESGFERGQCRRSTARRLGFYLSLDSMKLGQAPALARRGAAAER